jgi:SAM-dependent MidA family methyltransferase
MARALYDPESGYYERSEDPVGRQGDYFTSVSVGPVFGELLGPAFADWLERLPGDLSPVWLIETGAHDGRLAEDILGWVRQWRPTLWPRLNYGIVEPSRRRQAVQRQRLDAFTVQVQWFGSLGEVTAHNPSGVVFSNELLDALPVRRFIWRVEADAGRWVESAVDWPVDGRGLTWSDLDLADGEWEGDRWLMEQRSRFPDLEPVLPSGFVWEHPVGAINWWAEAAQALTRGWLVGMDYGRAADLPFSPERPGGTLRAFRGHRQVADLLADPGEQDLTADVDFDLIRRVGEAAGLVTTELRSQGQWLTALLSRVETEIERGGFPPWDANRRRQLLTLIHPEHLGARFQVLVQERGLTAV